MVQIPRKGERFAFQEVELEWIFDRSELPATFANVTGVVLDFMGLENTEDRVADYFLRLVEMVRVNAHTFLVDSHRDQAAFDDITALADRHTQDLERYRTVFARHPDGAAVFDWVVIRNASILTLPKQMGLMSTSAAGQGGPGEAWRSR